MSELIKCKLISEMLAWPDEERMSFLMTKFPQKSSLVNQTAYEDKVKFWKNRLTSGLIEKKRIIFDLFDVLRSDSFGLQYQSHAPDISILETVVKAEADNFPYLKDELTNADAIIRNVENSWTFWAYQKIPISIPFSKNDSRLVSIEALDKICDLICENKNKEIVNSDGMLKAISSIGKFSKNEEKLIIARLKKRKIINFTDGELSDKIYKFGAGEISSVEVAKYQIETTLAELENTISKKESEIVKLKKEAKVAYLNKLKSKAVTILRRAKTQEATLEQIYQQQYNLQGILEKLDNKSNEKEVLESLKIGTETLKNLQKEGVDHVEDVMDSLEDALADANEISDAISRNVKFDEDEEDVEAELELILKQSENEQHETITSCLPSPPKKLPEIKRVLDKADDFDELLTSLSDNFQKVHLEKSNPPVNGKKRCECLHEKIPEMT